MRTGWRYRILAVCGALVLTATAVGLANTALAQSIVTAFPVLDNLQRVTLTNDDLVDQIGFTVVITLAALWPLFKPQPRRILDAIALTQKRVLFAATMLATIGYFDWSTRLPRTTLIATTAFLVVVLPLWFVFIRRRPLTPSRAVIVGDDRTSIERLHDEATVPILGYVGPRGILSSHRQSDPAHATDGGEMRHVSASGRPEQHVASDSATLTRLGGLAVLKDIIVDHDIDTVLLGFAHPDREAFFGTLSTCHQNGIRALVHRDHAENVLVAEGGSDVLVDTDLEPWDWQEHVLKRLFDFLFAAVGLLVLSPFILLIALAIKLDSRGPILYGQERTAEFGRTFTIYKFRSMITEAETETGPIISAEDDGRTDPRVTSVGKVLRKTHMDEIPQLWSVLTGDMSVVGPRPERPELDANIESSVDEWRRRWFVKPGLTGLSQINDITGHEPAKKLRYDVEYVRRQSFWFDLKIVTRQLYGVVVDVGAMVLGRSNDPER